MKQPDYEGFALEICQVAFEGDDIDGASIQEIGLEYGVLRTEEFNEKMHKNILNAEYYDPGELVYCFNKPGKQPIWKRELFYWITLWAIAEIVFLVIALQ